MQNVLKSSFIYTFITALYSWFSQQWKNSAIITRFLTPPYGTDASDCSFFLRIWRFFHRGLFWVFTKLRLTRLFENSIFKKPFIWALSALALAPVLPTMLILALAALSLSSLLLSFACDKSRDLKFSPVNKYILLYAVVYVVSIITSVTLTGSLKGGALTVVFVAFSIAVINAIETRGQLYTAVFGFVIIGTVVSAYGLYQYVFGAIGASSWVDSEMFSDIGTRVFSTLGNPNMLAAYLLLVIPFAFACVLISKKPMIKLIFTGCLGVSLLCMLLTSARGGWLGLIASAAVFLILLDRRYILMGIAGIIVLYFTLPDFILNRFLSIGNLGDTSTAYRLSIWLGTLAMLRDYWFTGIGPGTAAFNKIYPMYSYNAAAAQHSHNLFLQIISDSGVSGIAVFLLLLFSYFRTLCSAMHREIDKSAKILQIAAVSAVAGFLVQGMTDYSFYNYRVTLVFWGVIGLGAVIARFSKLA